MSISNELGAVLTYIGYAAQFSHPMKDGIDRVMDSVVWPDLYRVHPGKHLRNIDCLLECDASLSREPCTMNQSDEDVRDFLKGLAIAIEHDFPNVRRSGEKVTRTGTWLCMEHTEYAKIFLQEETLPEVNGQRVVWEYKEVQEDLSAEAELENEFVTYYSYRSIRGIAVFGDVDDYAAASASRWLARLDQKGRYELGELLTHLAKHRGHPLIRRIEEKTGFDWTSSDENWDILKQLLPRMASLLLQEK